MPPTLAMTIYLIVRDWTVVDRILALCVGKSDVETIEFAKAYMKTGNKQ